MDTLVKLFQQTPLEHTPGNLSQQAVFREFFHSWLPGIAERVCDTRGVL